MTTTTATTTTLAPTEYQQPSRVKLVLRYMRRNPGLVIGFLILIGLVLFTVIGLLTIDTKDAYPLSAKPKQPPSAQYPFGTDFFGRNLLAAMVVGMWQTALIGVLAGAIGTFIGVVLGFVSAYFGGRIDSIIKGLSAVLIPIPVFLIQVVIAGSLDKRSVTIFTMAFIVVMLAWMGPTLVIRSQVLSMKERQFVSVAKLSGMGDSEIIFAEILPNLLPFYRGFLCGSGVLRSVRLVLSGSGWPGTAARAIAGEYYMGCPVAGSLLQRVVVVAGDPGSCHGVDPQLAGAD